VVLLQHNAVVMDNGYEMCEYVDEADEPFVGGVDFIANDDIDEVPDIVDETEVKPINVSGMLTSLPVPVQKRRGRPPKSESEKALVRFSFSSFDDWYFMNLASLWTCSTRIMDQSFAELKGRPNGLSLVSVWS